MYKQWGYFYFRYKYMYFLKENELAKILTK